MRLAAYLCTSRHGIFYFRFPLPVERHPERKRAHIKVSLRTREPREAQELARRLVIAGQCAISQPNVRAMRYFEMREHVQDHFGEMLRRFRERSADSGPVDGTALDALRASESLAGGDLEDWLDLSRYETELDLVRAFCALRGVEEVTEGREVRLLATEVQKGYREYVARALEHTAEFDTFSLEQVASTAPRALRARVGHNTIESDALPLADVLLRYFAELDRTQALAAKTSSEKRDALALMAELTGNKPPAHMTKADAQEIKAALFKLPKNRSKNPQTRGLPLGQVLELPNVERIATRTMNVYLGHMQHFFGWAVNNGYAAENVFQGLRLKRNPRESDEGRKAFSVEELRIMFSQLTDPDSLLVRKDVHKWPALIAMFTGMRLNEVAQLEVQDIELLNGLWIINVTPDGDDNKRLKNASSKRYVPVHDRLLASGFLAFHEKQEAHRSSRLFPDLSYSPQNGYGRNAGRWFNGRFLSALGLGGQGLVFHCLRHTMITRLAQAGVEEAMVKAIVGHSQTGVTLGTYFKEGFLAKQRQEAINMFDF